MSTSTTSPCSPDSIAAAAQSSTAVSLVSSSRARWRSANGPGTSASAVPRQISSADRSSAHRPLRRAAATRRSNSVRSAGASRQAYPLPVVMIRFPHARGGRSGSTSRRSALM
nr:hypothetical protein [Lentzea flava]